ncbi:hypothetical protein J6590_041253 [Homalodisca vitripennis]|nr:hypothetical protein J6590_041253 [Homalodisca vitripennis]
MAWFLRAVEAILFPEPQEGGAASQRNPHFRNAAIKTGNCCATSATLAASTAGAGRAIVGGSCDLATSAVLTLPLPLPREQDTALCPLPSDRKKGVLNVGRMTKSDRHDEHTRGYTVQCGLADCVRVQKNWS